MNIVLTGFMASGKTEISKAIAEISKYILVDTDELIVRKMNMTVNEIFDKYGEEYFRKIEQETVREAAEKKDAVIATGGGVVLNKQNIEVLRKTGRIFNLSPDFSVIKERLEEARKTRPLLKHDSIESIEKRFNDRKPFYDDCDYKVHVIKGRTPRSYALEILEIMEKKPGGIRK
ncbi:MAG: shikimate kinase [Hominilimicola sp.]